MRKPTSKIGAIFVLLALSAPSTHAQELIDGAYVGGVVAVAREFGSATLTSQTDGNPMIAGQIDDIPYSLRLRNCSENNHCEDMNFRVGFLVKPTLESMNQWNRDKRFAKAYLDQEGDAIIEMDTILEGGVSKENMREVFSYWRLTLAQFTKHIGF